MAASNPSGEVVKGDVDYDGCVVLYVIKGISTPANRLKRRLD